MRTDKAMQGQDAEGGVEPESQRRKSEAAFSSEPGPSICIWFEFKGGKHTFPKWEPRLLNPILSMRSQASPKEGGGPQ